MNREKLIIDKKLLTRQSILLSLKGMLTKEQTEELGEAIQKLTQNGHNRIIINMKNIAYINSMALRTMVKIFRQAQKDNAALIFTELSQQVEEIFRFTNLSRIFTIIENEEDAIRQF